MMRPELIFDQQITDCFSSYCRQNHISKAVIIADTNTQVFCLPLLNSDFPVITVPAGEPFKDLKTLESIFHRFIELKVNRQTVIVNLGGGVVSDIGGFAASVYQRGIPYINIPTTLLAMVDAAIGGKTGVDFLHYKNYLGAFNLPQAVMISDLFLQTLPAEELKSAWAEILKTGTICDAGILELIRKDAPLIDIIKATATCKDQLVTRDFKDENERQLLNFGHTIGHAFESYRLSIAQPVMHGIAVARGMLYETRLAVKLGHLQPDVAEHIIRLVKEKMSLEELSVEEFAGLRPFLSGDKKNEDSSITFSLPVEIGRGIYGVRLPLSEV
jgi:3-dehydroquinate synthase